MLAWAYPFTYDWGVTGRVDDNGGAGEKVGLGGCCGNGVKEWRIREGGGGFGMQWSKRGIMKKVLVGRN